MKTAPILMLVAAVVVAGTLLVSERRRPETHHAPTSARCFYSLGDLAGGTVDSVAYDISADGSVVVGYSNSDTGMEAFRWTARGGMAGLGFPRAYATTTDGAYAAGYRHVAGRAEPVCWTGCRVLSLRTFPDAPDLTCGEAAAISADGSVVVGTYRAASGLNTAVPFLWTSENGIERLGGPLGEAYFGDARDVSADGRVIVGSIYDTAGARQAYRWTKKTGMVPLGVLPGDIHSVAKAVSADGKVVVGVSQSNATQAFRWTETTGMIALESYDEARMSTSAMGISVDGSFVVGQCQCETGLDAFLWDAVHGMRSVKRLIGREPGVGAAVASWKLIAATGISHDGSVVCGYGLNPNGDREAWVAELRPDDRADDGMEKPAREAGHNELASLR